MTSRAETHAASDLDVLLRHGALGGLSDAELLERSRSGPGGGAAFGVLLERHGPMVLAVCRRVAGDAHDAEDAFQAAFLALLRGGGSLWLRGSLAPWLHTVARRVAERARREAIRRRDRERAAAVPEAASREEATGAELHEELDRLPEKYRAPIVLCCLEGRTLEEAGRTLGWPVGSVSGRLARARAMLRDRLMRRGVAVPGAAILILTASAVPQAMAAEAIAKAVRLAAGDGLAAVAGSPRVRDLARWGVRSMILSRLIAPGAVCLVVLLGAAGAGLSWAAMPVQEPPPREARKPAQALAATPVPSPASVLLRAAESVPADTDDPATLIALARAQSSLGERDAARQTLARAEAIVGRIPEGTLRFYHLVTLAVARDEAGDRAGGDRVMAQAEASAGKIATDFGRVHSWENLATVQAGRGDVAAARKAVARIAEEATAARQDFTRTTARAAEATVRTRIGDYDEAFRLAEASTEYERAAVLRAIAQAAGEDFWHAGLPKAAIGPEAREARLRIVHRVVALAETMKAGEQRPWGEVAIALAHLGAFDEALRFARRHGEGPIALPHMIDLTARPYFLMCVGLEQGKAGHVREADATFREAIALVDADPKLESRREQVVFGMADAGSLPAALDAVGSLKSDKQADLLARIAERQAKAGDEAASRETFRRALDAARATLDAGPPDRPRTRVPKQGAPIAVDGDGKTQPPDPIDPDLRWKAGRQIEIVRLLARSGALDAATAAASAVVTEDGRSFACSAVARARARRGDTAGTHAWASGLTEPKSRLAAIRGLATGIRERQTGPDPTLPR